MKEWTDKVSTGASLTAEDVAAVVVDLLSGSDDEAKADFLEAFHARGEKPGEIVLFAREFLQRAEPFPVDGEVLDVCGTGGDKLGLFNVSTAVMFVAAGAGARLVKHGNRGITSRSGGADVLEALGLPLDLPTEKMRAMLDETGAVFLFAPRFHPAFKAVASARKILAARGRASIFNMLGPLLNPSRPAFQLTGVFSEKLVDIYAGVMPELGRRRAWVVHGTVEGAGVMDELSTLGPTLIADVEGGEIRKHCLLSTEAGIPSGDLATLRGGDAAENAALINGILSGRTKGPARDIVIYNAAAALQVCGLAGGWAEAVALAGESVDSGAAARVLQRMVAIANA
jgi:anthranilate phosphoribosyltransferase